MESQLRNKAMAMRLGCLNKRSFLSVSSVVLRMSMESLFSIRGICS
jgi:hypothetical protein